MPSPSLSFAVYARPEIKEGDESAWVVSSAHFTVDAAIEAERRVRAGVDTQIRVNGASSVTDAPVIVPSMAFILPLFDTSQYEHCPCGHAGSVLHTIMVWDHDGQAFVALDEYTEVEMPLDTLKAVAYEQHVIRCRRLGVEP